MATVAVDLDGVCYEWHRTYVYMMKHYRGVEFPEGDAWWSEWNSPDEYTSPQDRQWIWSRGVELGLFRHGHVTKDTIVGVSQLVRLGHELIVVTHRPKGAVRDTINWLDHHFGGLDPYPWANVHLLTDGQPKNTIEADILIDDKLENITDWTMSGRDAILFDRPWNQADAIHGEGNAFRARGWKEVARYLALGKDPV